MDVLLDIPSSLGEGMEFEDVTAVFANAALDMDPEKMYFMEGFTLMDAMSAFEIGEPRLDTGYIGEHLPGPFDPLARLLPAEVCWILDSALACEMEWHSGSMLAHTVFTVTYIYHLTDIDSESMIPVFLSEDDPERPIQLVTTVLGPCVQGLLKCVDMTWRQMHGNDLIEDMEDWQSDKSEVPVMEAVPVNFVIERLQMAAHFIANSPKIQEAWRRPLIARVLLRKTLLEIFKLTDLCRHHNEYQLLLSQAREYLQYLQSQPPIILPQDSPARAAFDPYISRRLNTSVPARIIPMSTEQETWSRVNGLLDGLRETIDLVSCHNLTTWEVVGKLRLWLNDAPRPTYVRSVTQTSFYDGVLVLSQFTFAWVLDQFFVEATGCTWTSIAAMVKKSWTKSSPPPIAQLERRLYKLVIQHIKSLWLNPPRRRRYLMKSVVEWHAVYDLCVDIANSLLGVQDHIVSKLPQIILVFRLDIILEIVLSGFQLELYAPEERSHAYWYAAKVVEAQIECYDDLLSFMSQDSKPYQEIIYRQQVLLALGALSTAMFLVTLPLASSNWGHTQPAFFRRYKWAYRPEYGSIRTPPVAHPDLYDFMRSLNDENLPPMEHVHFARSIVNELLGTRNVGGWADQWAQERVRFLQGLLGVCEELEALPSPLEECNSFDPRRRLKWDPARVHPWFPTVVPAT